MAGDAADVLEYRPAVGAKFHQLVIDARQHAMRGGQDQVARKRNAGA